MDEVEIVRRKNGWLDFFFFFCWGSPSRTVTTPANDEARTRGLVERRFLVSRTYRFLFFIRLGGDQGLVST